MKKNEDLKTTTRFRKWLAASTALVLSTAAAPAAMTIARTGSANPVTDAADQFYFPGAVNEQTGAILGDTGVNYDSGPNDMYTYTENSRPSRIQTFTTGSSTGGFTIGSFSVQTRLFSELWGNGTYANLQPGANFQVRFGTISGTTLTPLRTDTTVPFGGPAIAYGGNQLGIGEWLTIDLSQMEDQIAIGTLSSNTTYFVELVLNNGWIELNNTRGAGYTGGEAFFGGNNGALDSDGTVTAVPAVPNGGGDYAFHANLTAIPEPSSSALMLGGIALLFCFRRRA